MSQIQEKLRAALPASLRRILADSSQQDLLKSVAHTVVVRDGHCLHLESGRSAQFQSEPAPVDVTALAQCVRTLLPVDSHDEALRLLLPAEEFVGIPVELAGVSSETLYSALLLQCESILPTYESDLALSVNPAGANFESPHVALWMRQSRLDEYFSALSDAGVFLAVVSPRSLIAVDASADCLIIDRDAGTGTAIHNEAGVIKQWSHVLNSDLQQEMFREEWETTCANQADVNVVNLNDLQDFTDNYSGGFTALYRFFPEGALAARKQAEKGKKFLVAAAAAVVVLLLSSIPFVAQSVEFRLKAANLEASRELSADARRDQSIVIDFEDTWGPINDFPDQRIREAMFTLQSILLPDKLSSMEVDEGLIRIQGTSSEPQSILQRLEQHPMFTEVVFSRATNNDRYFIDLRLSTVNFDAYMVRYFPDE